MNGCFDDNASGDAAVVDASTATDDGTSNDTGVVPDGGTATTDAGATDAPAAAPTVTVTAPAAGAMLPVGASTQLTLAVTNFALTNFIGASANHAGVGHFHVYLDGAADADYLLADYIPMPRVVIPNGTALGAHTLRISLRNNDHTALSPAVETTLSFTAVMTSAPSVTINAPADNTSVAAGASITMMLAFRNFMPRPYAPIADAGVMPPYGHFHVYLDGASGSSYLIATDVANPVVQIPATTTAGPHRLTVSLRNDDHSEIVGASADLRIAVTH